MGINVVWDNAEKTIIRWDFDPDWSWEDFDRSTDRSVALVEGLDCPADLILNMTDTKIIPREGIAVRHIKRGMIEATSQGGIVVVTGGSFLAQTLVFLFQKLYGDMGQSFFLAHTVEEARHTIAQYRQ